MPPLSPKVRWKAPSNSRRSVKIFGEFVDSRPVLAREIWRSRRDQLLRRREAELAGTYQIGSVARCVFALEPASENTEDDRVVLTCCKNNDGIEGQPSAWHRKNGLFGECEDFDWEAFNAGEINEQVINLEAIRRVLSGTDWLTRGAAVKRLVDADLTKSQQVSMPSFVLRATLRKTRAERKSD